MRETPYAPNGDKAGLDIARLQGALHLYRCLTLVGRILEQERRFELPLPRPVGRGGGLGGHLATRIEVEQLHGHFLQRRARLVALLRPPPAAELVQPRRYGIGPRFGGPVPLDLVDAVERHVEPVAPLVLDDRHLDGALAHEHALDPAIDPDPVLEVDYVVAGLERGDRFDRGAGGVPPLPADATIPAKDLVIGQHAQPARA